jgi:pimeloyl-ACP methyl ester carboxylesterase
VNLSANGINIEAEDFGRPGDPCVFLIIGLGLQLTYWPRSMISGLVQHGYRVVVMDNRDAGWSKSFDEWGVPNLFWGGLKQKFGLDMALPYTLEDMAQDAFGVMSALGLERAHVMGMSMGGMIAQHMAILAPERVCSLVSMMSTSGASGLPAPDPFLLKKLFMYSGAKTPDAWIEQGLKAVNLLSSPAFKDDPATMQSRVAQAVQRSLRPAGIVRQLAAVMADTQRAERLHEIQAPTLVIHGDQDPLIAPACGFDTHERIPHSKWLPIEGLSHEIPFALVPTLLPHLLDFFNEHP